MRKGRNCAVVPWCPGVIAAGRLATLGLALSCTRPAVEPET